MWRNSTEGYWISKDRYTGEWTVGMTGKFSKNVGSLDPNSGRDHQTQSEIVGYNPSSINIDGTYFKWLCVKRTDVDWEVWDRHVGDVDPPYWINQISNYEFKAGVGG